MSTARLHQLVERLGSLFAASMRQAASAHGLKLVQLEALVFLSQANRYSDTPLTLAEYLVVTKGTVSQTLKALERRELINKEADANDGRVVHCTLTDAGRSIVAGAYPAGLLRELPAGEGDAAAASLESLLRTLQRSNGSRTFGVCRTCRFFESRSRGGRCGRTGEPLTRADTDKLCREHEEPAHASATVP